MPIFPNSSSVFSINNNILTANKSVTIMIDFTGRYVHGDAWSYWKIYKNSSVIYQSTEGKTFIEQIKLELEQGDTFKILGKSQNSTACSWTCGIFILS